MNQKEESPTAIAISGVYLNLIGLINHASAKATIEALAQQNIKLTQEQKDNILKEITASNANYLKRNPLNLDSSTPLQYVF